jgi:hypothetical protein
LTSLSPTTLLKHIERRNRKMAEAGMTILDCQYLIMLVEELASILQYSSNVDYVTNAVAEANKKRKKKEEI